MILPALGGLASIQGMLKALQAQTARNHLELIVLARQEMALSQADLVVVTGDRLLHEARALGCRQASADYVVFAEDHCFPDPEWAEALLGRLEEGWDVVGPSMRSGNPTSLWAQAAFVIGYGEWMVPVRARWLPGHNAAVRRDLLPQDLESLADELLVGSLLMRRLQREGARFCFEERAGMAHWDPTEIPWALLTFLVVGAGFGARRSRPWPFCARLLYGFAFPAVALWHWRRACRHLWRVRPRMSGWAAAPALALATAWAAGETLGSWLGVSVIAPWVGLGEVNRLAHVGAAYCPPR